VACSALEAGARTQLSSRWAWNLLDAEAARRTNDDDDDDDDAAVAGSHRASLTSEDCWRRRGIVIADRPTLSGRRRQLRAATAATVPRAHNSRISSISIVALISFTCDARQ